MDRHAPGFGRAVRYRRMLDPTEFTAIHGLSSALAGPIPTAEDEPWPTEVEPGRYRMGNGIGPPGGHANAAMLSALWATERALEHL